MSHICGIYIYIYMFGWILQIFFFKIFKWRCSSPLTNLLISGSSWWRKYPILAQVLLTILLVIFTGCIRSFVAVGFFHIIDVIGLKYRPYIYIYIYTHIEKIKRKKNVWGFVYLTVHFDLKHFCIDQNYFCMRNDYDRQILIQLARSTSPDEDF